MTDVKGQARGRRDRTEATERRIVKAAYALFCARGYTGTTMADVAREAEVAVQTVYFIFRTKPALLREAYSYAVMGDEKPQIPQDQPWYRQMVAATDAVTGLRALVSGVGEIARRVAPLATAAQDSARSDPEVQDVVAFQERWRAAGHAEMLDILVAKSALRAGLDPKHANDLLLLFVGMDVYNALVGTAGWTHEAWVDWTVSALAHHLFGIEPT
jgi:AcrR family transcriptional regulator